MASASAVECTATVWMPISWAGAMDAKRDFAAIGDQDFLEQGCYGPYSDDHDQRLAEFDRLGVDTTRICVTVPALGALIGFITFIASMISSVSPDAHRAGRPTGEGLGAPGSACEIGGAHHRRNHRVAVRSGRGWRGGNGGRWPQAAAAAAADMNGAAAVAAMVSAGHADPAIALGDLDLRQVRSRRAIPPVRRSCAASIFMGSISERLESMVSLQD